MNDLLRLLRKFLRRYGYDIKNYYEYNLLPIKNLQEFNQLSILHDNAEQPPDSVEKKDFDVFIVCLRTCLRHQGQKPKDDNVAGADHHELVFRCLNSLVMSTNHAMEKMHDKSFEFIIFDDHSEPEYVKVFEKICSGLRCKWNIKTTKEPGQGKSLYEQFEFARDSNALFYFCEDDYLHEPEAVSEMIGFYQQVYNTCNTHCIIHPQEIEFIYVRYIYPSYLLLGKQRHWRTISHATHVLFTHSDVVKDFWHHFEKTRFVGDKKNRMLGSEARNTNLIFNHIPGFAPIPALAAHMQTENCIPAHFNWEKLWEASKPE